jgi:hypothetical protein
VVDRGEDRNCPSTRRRSINKEGEGMSQDGCGVAAHSDECLCDVRETEPLGYIPNVRLSWGGDHLVRALMRGEPLLDVLEKVVTAHDLWKNRENAREAFSEEQVSSVKLAFADGGTLPGVLAEHALTAQMFVHMVQPGCDEYASALTETQLLDIQLHGQSGGTARAMERRYNLQKRFVRQLFDIFGIKPDQRKCSPSDKLTIEQRREVVAMVMTGEHSHGQMQSYCVNKYNVHLDRTYFSKLRARENERLAGARQKRKAT